MLVDRLLFGSCFFWDRRFMPTRRTTTASRSTTRRSTSGSVKKSVGGSKKPSVLPEAKSSALLAPKGLPLGRAWVLDVPFEWRSWASSQQVRWDVRARVSVYRGSFLPAHLAHLAAQPYSWEWHQQAALNGESPEAPALLHPVWDLRPHQEEARESIEAARRAGWMGFILADDVGTGKTLSAWGGVRAAPKPLRVLVVTTSSATAHWRNTLLHAGVGHSVPLIINYDRLGRLFEDPDTPLSSQRAKGRRKRVAREGKAPVYDWVIWDESHKCKNLDSARAIMMRKINAKAGFVLWLSATAGQNPLELAYLAPLLAQVTGHKASALLADFEAWCLAQDVGVSRGAFGRWVWERTPEREKKVRGWLFGGSPRVGLRRLPTDISGWPALVRQLMPQELDASARQAYAQAWEEFRVSEMGAGRVARERGQNALTARLRLRQKSSWLRIGATASMVQDLLDSDRQVAVSVAFTDTMRELAQRLQSVGPVAVLWGGQSPEEKEAERLRFQRGEARVIVFTVEEAISLHQGEHNDVPRTLLVHDLRWSAIQQAQIEGRCHRDGRFAPVLWLYAPGTVEERIAQVLLERVKGMKAMHGDDCTDLAAIDAVLAAALNHLPA